MYLSVDPRSLGLFRIVFGLVLLADLLRRYLGVGYGYWPGAPAGVESADSRHLVRIRQSVSWAESAPRLLCWSFGFAR
jgi:hypothetical protein